MQPIDIVARPDAALLRLLVAGLLGGLIGVERERASRLARERMFAGVRTFPLFAILGASLTIVSGEIGLAVVAGFLAVAGLGLVAYWRTSASGEVGTTTESAALATYWIGAIAGTGAFVLAGAIGIAIAVLLASKERLEAFPEAMTPEELRAALTFAVIAVVILPILPNRPYGPWGVWNPRDLWSVVVLVCGLSFAAFLAMRFWGSRRGLYLSGLLGGLVSSTAITISFAARSRNTPANATHLAIASGLASTVMLFRIAFFATVAGPSVLPALLPFLAVTAAAGAIAMVVLARRRTQPSSDGPGVANPFQLREAIRWAIVYAAVLFAVAFARHRFGPWGVVAASVLAGVADLDAITLSLAALSGGELQPEVAAGGIAIATLTNTVVKGAYAVWRGEAAYRRTLLAILGTVFVAGVAAFALLGLRPWK
jgi:uncharacterized membrane protein (DUF4010 family)